jgi:hypothetical protein
MRGTVSLMLAIGLPVDLENGSPVSIYITQCILLVLLIFFMAGLAFFVHSSAVSFLETTRLSNDESDFRLAALLSSCPPGIIIMKLLQRLSNTADKYVAELKEFNLRIETISQSKARTSGSVI